MQDSLHDDYMLVGIEPSFRDDRNGVIQIDMLILSTRLIPFSLYPIISWPVHVYVARVVEPEILQTLKFTKDDVRLIAWGALFQTLEDAQAFASNA
jgi:hypothetical protein